jgi:hypothetical protein
MPSSPIARESSFAQATNSGVFDGASTAACSSGTGRSGAARKVAGGVVRVKPSRHSLLARIGPLDRSENTRPLPGRVSPQVDRAAVVWVDRVVNEWSNASSISRLEALAQYMVLRELDIQIIACLGRDGRPRDYMAFRPPTLGSRMSQIIGDGEVPEFTPGAHFSECQRGVHDLFDSFGRCLPGDQKWKVPPNTAGAIEPPSGSDMATAGFRYKKIFPVGELTMHLFRDMLIAIDVCAARPAVHNECFERRLTSLTLHLLMRCLERRIGRDPNLPISGNDFNYVQSLYPDTLCRGEAIYNSLHSSKPFGGLI